MLMKVNRRHPDQLGAEQVQQLLLFSRLCACGITISVR